MIGTARAGPFGVGVLAATIQAAALCLAGCDGTNPPEPDPDVEPAATASAPALSPLEVAELQGDLQLEDPRVGHLDAGEIHRYSFELDANEGVALEIAQSDVDIDVAVFDPLDRPILHIDTPVGQAAPEKLCFVTEGAGTFALLVAPFNAAGDYRVELRHRSPASDTDRTCEQAQSLFAAADSLLQGNGPTPAVIADFERASGLWYQAGKPFLAAMALREAGSAAAIINRPLDAIDFFQRARPLALQAGSIYMEINVLDRLATVLLEQGKIESSEALLQQGLTLSLESADRHREADIRHGLAEVRLTAGEPHQAIELWQQALGIRRELDLELETASTVERIGTAYAQLDHHQEALDFLNEALAISRRHGDQNIEGSVLLSIGWAHVLHRTPDQAVPFFQRALEIQRLLGNRNAQSALLDRLGTALLETGQYAESLQAYRDAFQLAEQDGSVRDAANTASNIGCLYQRWGKVDAAIDQLTEARRRLQAINDPLALSHAESCLARVEQQRGNVEAALGHIEEALGIVERLRGAARRRGGRHRPIGLWQDYSELEVDLLMSSYITTSDQHVAARAFETADLARARNLFELILESAIEVRSTAPDTLLATEHRIQTDLNTLEARRRELLAQGAAEADIRALEKQLGESSLELERARTAIRRADPRYAELAEPRPIQLAELQALLDTETILLSYAFGTAKSYLFAVGASSFATWTLESASQLNAQAEVLHQALRESRSNPIQFQLAAASLAEKVLPPGAIPTSVRRLLVVADGALHYVPLGILPSPRSADSASEPRWLLDDLEIQMLPSVSALAALRLRDANRPTPPDSVVVFADAVFAAEDPRLTGEAETTESNSTNHQRIRSVRVDRLPDGPLPRLPHTRAEAKSILAVVESQRVAPDRVAEADPAVAYLDFDASKFNVLNAPLDRYRIVHFASHALIDEQFPELSGLVLSRRDASGRAVDGNLHLHEIYNLRLAAELVVLSGCQTALGQWVRGDGLLSLTRGFLYAGSSQVLVSLWSVDDEATALLMAELYRGMIERREPPAAALRAAQRWMRQQPQWHAPYYWAAFVLQGADS